MQGFTRGGGRGSTRRLRSSRHGFGDELDSAVHPIEVYLQRPCAFDRDVVLPRAGEYQVRSWCLSSRR